MSLLIIARDELVRLFATRRGWLSVAAFVALWALALIYVVVPITRFLANSDESGMLEMVLGPLGLAALAGWPSPQLVVYWVIALYLLPPFAVLVAADQTASDLGRGTLRFHALRASRPAIYLGRFSGQCLVQLGLVLATLATVLVAIGVQTPDRLPDSLLAAPFVVLNLMVLLLPWVALMGVCSAVARSPRQATLFAVLAWIVVTLALSLARDAFGPLALFDHVMPGSEAGTLRGLADPATLALLPVPLIQTLVLLALGLFAFGRRDL